MGSGSHCMSYKISQLELYKTGYSLLDNPHCSMEVFLGVPQADSFLIKSENIIFIFLITYFVLFPVFVSKGMWLFSV